MTHFLIITDRQKYYDAIDSFDVTQRARDEMKAEVVTEATPFLVCVPINHVLVASLFEIQSVELQCASKQWNTNINRIAMATSILKSRHARIDPAHPRSLLLMTKDRPGYVSESIERWRYRHNFIATSAEIRKILKEFEAEIMPYDSTLEVRPYWGRWE